MAQRRMISLSVIDTDAFTDMPVSVQNLYFHLNARADDDGFVASPRRIMKMIGSQEDDFKILVAKKFVIVFKDGVCVIKHWRLNNFIRKDIYKETNYIDLKQTLFIRSNGVYTLTKDDRAIPVPEGHFKIEDISRNSTLTVRQLSKEKCSVGKVNTIPRKRAVVTKKNDNEKINWNEYLTKMENDENLHIQVIAYFFRRRKLRYDTIGEVHIAIRRHLRAARDVAKFSKDKVLKAMDVCDEMDKKDNIQWTLETVIKILTK